LILPEKLLRGDFCGSYRLVVLLCRHYSRQAEFFDLSVHKCDFRDFRVKVDSWYHFWSKVA